MTITAVMVKQAHFEFITAVIIISTGSGKEALSFTPNNLTMSFTPRILKHYFMRSNEPYELFNFAGTTTSVAIKSTVLKEHKFTHSPVKMYFIN